MITKRFFSRNQTLILVSCFLAISFLMTQTVWAASIFQQAETGFKTMMTKAYGSDQVGPTTFLENLIKIINYMITLVGVLFLLGLIYAGYLWMTAKGNDEQIAKAKKMAQELLIGIIIIFLARLITEFILSQIGKVAQ